MTTNLPPKPRPTVRNVAFDVIDGERDYQDAKHPGPRTLIDDANLLIEFTDKLAVAVTVESPSPSANPREILREIAAIATRAMEDHGIVPRENHVPASAGITGVVKIVGKADAVGPAPKK